MKKRLLLFLVAIGLVMSFLTSINVSASDKMTPSGLSYDRVKGEINNFLSQNRVAISSCEVAVFDKEGIISSDYFGYSDIEKKSGC